MENVTSSESEDALEIGWEKHILMDNALSEARCILLNYIIGIFDELCSRFCIPFLSSSQLCWSILNEQSSYYLPVFILI
jgi:hypothetical protein